MLGDAFAIKKGYLRRLQAASVPSAIAQPRLEALAAVRRPTLGLWEMTRAYGLIHPFLCTAICLAGIILNVLTIVVLTRPRMLTPVNIILCEVAVCDLLVITSYLVFLAHFEMDGRAGCEAGEVFSYAWGVFALVHAHSSLIAHSTSLWLTIALALLRVASLRSAVQVCFLEPIGMDTGFPKRIETRG